MGADIVIIDSGGANIASLMYSIRRLGKTAALTRDARKIRSARHVVLPGVGAARDAMQRLRDHDLVDVIRGLTQPVLGICLGMQLLAERSEEDDVECLGVIPGVASRLPASAGFPVPNMGWCQLERQRPHEVMRSIADREYFYFLHSYALPVTDLTLATADHAQPFSAIVCKDNFVAAQFHPERSSSAGAQLLENFFGLAA